MTSSPRNNDTSRVVGVVSNLVFKNVTARRSEQSSLIGSRVKDSPITNVLLDGVHLSIGKWFPKRLDASQTPHIHDYRPGPKGEVRLFKRWGENE